MIRSRYGLLFILLISLIILNTTKAQFNTFTPYSQFGLGTPAAVSSAPITAMGSGYTGIRSQQYINFYNPASYSAFDVTLFQLGFEAQQFRQSRGTQAQSGSLAFMNQMNFAIPLIKRRLGISFGYMPYSSVRYNLVNYDSVYTNNDTVRVNYQYEGRGGLDRFYLGLGGEVYKGLSLGFNASVYLGTLYKNKTSIWETSLAGVNTRLKQTTRVVDFNMDFGIQYVFKVKKVTMTVGGTYEIGKKLRAKNLTTVEYFTDQIGDNPFAFDTLTQSNNNYYTLPSRFSVGVAVGKPDKWNVHADFQSTRWGSDYTFNGQRESTFRDAYQATVGFEVIPKANATKNYFNRIAYRLGGRYTLPYLAPLGSQYKEFAVSAGFGIPLMNNDLMEIGKKKLPSYVNLAFEYSVRSNSNQAITVQNTFRFVMSFNIRAQWFNKNKYN